MKKKLAGIGILAIVAFGASGVSFPANAVESQPVAEVVTIATPTIEAADVVLSQPEPDVTTTPAETVVEPVTVAVEVPVAPEVPVTVPALVAAPVAPVVFTPLPVPVPVPVPAPTVPVSAADAIDLDAVPVWTDEDRAIPSSVWDTRTPEQVAEQESRQPPAELFVVPTS